MASQLVGSTGGRDLLMILLVGRLRAALPDLDDVLVLEQASDDFVNRLLGLELFGFLRRECAWLSGQHRVGHFLRAGALGVDADVVWHWQASEAELLVVLER